MKAILKHSVRRYSSAPKIPLFINGEHVESKSDTWIPLTDPATGKVIGQVPETTPEEFELAVKSSQEAFEQWRHVGVYKRSRYIHEFQRLIVEKTDDIAEAISKEQGKIFSDAKGEVFRGQEVIEHSASVPSLMMGETQQQVGPDIDIHSYREPLGVTAAVIPFNFPAMIPCWTVGLSLACGNSMIFKTSEQDPTASLMIAELAMEAGFPKGLVNVVHGQIPVSNKICDHPDIKSISFVGGDTAGKAIFARGTANGKRVQSNMGANNHGVIMPDANKENALNQIVAAAFGAAGQRCMALPNIIFVGESKEWIPDLVEKAAQLNVGVWNDPEADVGPVISKASLDNVHNLLEMAEKEGAVLDLDGRNPNVGEELKGGNWVGPTVVSNVDPEGEFYKHEIFAPVVKVQSVDTLDDAIKLINANPYGNGTAIFTKSGNVARKFTYEIDVGQVGIGIPIPVPLPSFSFTGSRGSIQGDTHFYGKDGVRFLTKLKTVTSSWPSSDADVGMSVKAFPTFSK